MTEGTIQQIIKYWHARHYHIRDEYVEELQQELIEKIKQIIPNDIYDKNKHCDCSECKNNMSILSKLIGDNES